MSSSDEDSGVDGIICFSCKHKKNNSTIEDENYKTCEKCNWAFHPRCFSKRIVTGKSNLCCTYVAQSTFVLKNAYESNCKDIADIKKSLGNLGDRIVSAEIDNLNSDISSLMEKCDQTTAKAINEIALRKRKEANIILYNIADTNNNDLDRSNVIKLLQVAQVEKAEFTHSRIGIFSLNNHRPMIITFKNKEHARKMIGARKKITAINSGRNTGKKVGISTDKTVYQRELLKNAIIEVEERKKKGELVEIKYINGNPTVSKKRQNKTQQSADDTVLDE